MTTTTDPMNGQPIFRCAYGHAHTVAARARACEARPSAAKSAQALFGPRRDAVDQVIAKLGRASKDAVQLMRDLHGAATAARTAGMYLLSESLTLQANAAEAIAIQAERGRDLSVAARDNAARKAV